MVIFLVGVITAFALVSFRQMRNRAALEDGQALVLHALEGARSKAATGNGEGVDHGVRIDSSDGSITTFERDGFGVDSNELTVLLPPSVYTESDAEVIFARLTALPSTAADIELKSTVLSGTVLGVSVSENGKIDQEE